MKHIQRPGNSLFTPLRQLAALTACAGLALSAWAQSAPQSPLFPPNFKGEDCDTLATVLKSSAPKKDEFESTSDYDKRIQGALATMSVSGKPLAEPRYFVNSDQISGTYDADKGAMKVYGSLRQSTKVSPAINYASTVIVKIRSAKTSQYEGKNRFGTSTTVKNYRDEICGVAFLNVSPVTDHQWMGKIEFPLSADVARRSKGNIGIVYLARLAPPFVVEHRQYIAPTISAPSEILVTGDAMTAVLDHFYVVNRRTGEVLYDRQYTVK